MLANIREYLDLHAHDRGLRLPFTFDFHHAAFSGSHTAVVLIGSGEVEVLRGAAQGGR